MVPLLLPLFLLYSLVNTRPQQVRSGTETSTEKNLCWRYSSGSVRGNSVLKEETGKTITHCASGCLAETLLEDLHCSQQDR